MVTRHDFARAAMCAAVLMMATGTAAIAAGPQAPAQTPAKGFILDAFSLSGRGSALDPPGPGSPGPAIRPVLRPYLPRHERTILSLQKAALFT